MVKQRRQREAFSRWQTLRHFRIWVWEVLDATALKLSRGFNYFNPELAPFDHVWKIDACFILFCVIGSALLVEILSTQMLCCSLANTQWPKLALVLWLNLNHYGLFKGQSHWPGEKGGGSVSTRAGMQDQIENKSYVPCTAVECQQRDIGDFLVYKFESDHCPIASLRQQRNVFFLPINNKALFLRWLNQRAKTAREKLLPLCIKKT